MSTSIFLTVFSAYYFRRTDVRIKVGGIFQLPLEFMLQCGYLVFFYCFGFTILRKYFAIRQSSLRLRHCILVYINSGSYERSS